MDLCSENHEEICFEGRICPACALKESKDEEIDDLSNRITELENEVENFEEEIFKLQEKLDASR